MEGVAREKERLLSRLEAKEREVGGLATKVSLRGGWDALSVRSGQHQGRVAKRCSTLQPCAAAAVPWRWRAKPAKPLASRHPSPGLAAHLRPDTPFPPLRRRFRSS